MGASNDQVRESIQRLSDADLVRLVEVDHRAYTEEALAFAKEEMGRRGILREGSPVGTVAPDGKAPSGEIIREPVPRRLSKAWAAWGAFWLVLAAVIAYAAVLGIATIFVGKRYGMTPSSDAVPRLFFYAALIAVLMWAGIRRRPRWESFFAIPLAVIAILAFLARFSLRTVDANGMIISKAALVTAVVLAALAGVFFLLGVARRRSEK